MDDCAGEMAELGDMGDLNLEGSVTASPGEPGRGIPHLSLLDGLRVGNRPDGTVTALPGVLKGRSTYPGHLRIGDARFSGRLQHLA
eukprot:6369678-Amphidinium_carterae.4